jgi:hypothetical protein
VLEGAESADTADPWRKMDDDAVKVGFLVLQD